MEATTDETTTANDDAAAQYTCPVCGWSGLFLQRAIEAHRDKPTRLCLGRCRPPSATDHRIRDNQLRAEYPGLQDAELGLDPAFGYDAGGNPVW